MPENNEIIEVGTENAATEIVEKVTFTTGEKVALGVVLSGVALIGYGVGRYMIEPLVKKAANGIANLITGAIAKKSQKVDLKDLRGLMDEDDVIDRRDITIEGEEDEDE